MRNKQNGSNRAIDNSSQSRQEQVREKFNLIGWGAQISATFRQITDSNFKASIAAMDNFQWPILHTLHAQENTYTDTIFPGANELSVCVQ